MSRAQPFIFLLVKTQVYTFFSFPFPLSSPFYKYHLRVEEDNPPLVAE